jgi:hypothetical protein
MEQHEPDKNFAASEAWFAISLLRQSRANAASRPFAEDDNLDRTIEETAEIAHRRLMEHLLSLPKDKQSDATGVIFWAMIREHLHATSRRPAGWRGNSRFGVRLNTSPPTG